MMANVALKLVDLNMISEKAATSTLKDAKSLSTKMYKAVAFVKENSQKEIKTLESLHSSLSRWGYSAKRQKDGIVIYSKDDNAVSISGDESQDKFTVKLFKK